MRMMLSRSFSFSLSTIKSPFLISSFFILLFCYPPQYLTIPQRTRCSTVTDLKCSDPNAKCVRAIHSFIEYCECKSGFKYEPFAFPYCIKPVPIGQSCNNSLQCKQNDPRSICSFSTRQICQCDTEYYLNLITWKCVSRYIRLNQTIGQTTRSIPRSSTIISTTPPTNSTKDTRDNIRRCSYNKSCTDPAAKCVYDSNSRFGLCQCDFGYRPDPFVDLYCLKPVSFGQNCTSSKECRLSDIFTTCSSSNPRVCECLLDHVYNHDTKKCDLDPSDLIAALILLIPVFVLFFATMSLCIILIRTVKPKNRDGSTSTADSSSQQNDTANSDQTTNPPSRATGTGIFSDDFNTTMDQIFPEVSFAFYPSAPPMAEDRPPTYEESVYGSSVLFNTR